MEQVGTTQLSNEVASGYYIIIIVNKTCKQGDIQNNKRSILENRRI